MDPMLLGETVSASAANEYYYGFWMPAGGNDGVGGVEVYAIETSDDFDVDMQTKKSDQDDDAATSIVTTPEAIDDGVGVYKFDLEDANDLVRYRIKSNAAGYMHFQFTQPMWAPN